MEAQKKIEEMLRLENVQKNMEVAMEEMPEVSPRCSAVNLSAHAQRMLSSLCAYSVLWVTCCRDSPSGA